MRKWRLTGHLEFCKRHPFQLYSKQLTGSVFEKLKKLNSLAIVKIGQHPVLLPKMFVTNLESNRK